MQPCCPGTWRIWVGGEVAEGGKGVEGEAAVDTEETEGVVEGGRAPLGDTGPASKA